MSFMILRLFGFALLTVSSLAPVQSAPASLPTFTRVTAVAVVDLFLRGSHGLRFEVDSSLNLSAWNLLSTLTITNFDDTASLTDTKLSKAGSTFYRALFAQ